LEQTDGSSGFLASDVLHELLNSTGTVRAAILNACESHETASALAQQGIAAVGMQESLRSEAATHFSRSLYESLASGLSFDMAVNCARFTVRLECGADRKDWWVPVVLLPGAMADLFVLEQPVTVIQVISSPEGANILLDGINTGKRTPDTLMIDDRRTHRITVHKSNYEDPVLQEISGRSTRQPVRLEFILRPKTGLVKVCSNCPKTNILLISHQRDKCRLLGITGKDGMLGPSTVPVGQYYLEATHEWLKSGELPGRVDASKEITVRQGRTTNVTLNLPGRSITWTNFATIVFGKSVIESDRTKKILSIILITLVLSAGFISSIYYLSERSRVSKEEVQGTFAPERRTKALPIEDSVAIPEGNLFKGHWDGSVSSHLLQKYGLARGSALTQLIRIPERTVKLEGFFIDKYEVTNAKYRVFLEYVRRTGDRTMCHPDEPLGKDHTPKYWHDPLFNKDDQPVVGVDWYDAYAYAQWSGARLPAEDEWELAARGPGKRPYPWGSAYSGDFYIGGGPQRVGTLPIDSNSVPVGMGCNVAEWTASFQADSRFVIFRGGAWGHIPGDIYALTFLRFYAQCTHREKSIGFRCAWDTEPTAPAETVRIEGGEVKLGGDNTPLLSLIRRHADSVAVPRKAFFSDESTVARVRTYRIDKYEVTNAKYRVFLEYVRRTGDRTMCHPDEPLGKDHTPKYWHDPLFNKDDQPVVGVDWYDAYAYAHWAGGRLPTGNEWEFAARGVTKNLYPWGDEFDKTRCVCAESGATTTENVNSYVRACSPNGVFHMSGNVMEWTAEDFRHGTAGAKVLRGGSWKTACEIYGLTYLRQLGARREHRDNDVGFRCVILDRTNGGQSKR
jgi:formylglycine-generating enzyme required for sulfatase activity